MADWWTWGAGIAAALALVGLVVVIVLLRRQERPVELEVLGEEPAPQGSGPGPGPGERWPDPRPAAPGSRPSPPSFDDDDVFSVSKDELHPRAIPARPLPANEGSVPTEWARRQVGPLEPGRVRGICSGCGTTISVSRNRPIRVACPVCGRTRLLG